MNGASEDSKDFLDISKKICSDKSFSTCFQYQIFAREESSAFLTFNSQLLLFSKKESSLEQGLKSLENSKINSLALGENFIICLTEENLTYVWGRNNYGQLGLGDTNNRSNPTLFSLPNNEKISFITCGDLHVLCLTENKLTYVWGRNEYGELGLGDKTHRSSPTLLSLPNNEIIIFSSCGRNHTACITEKKNCYVWGRNEYGQLGLGHNLNNRSIPTLLTLPNNERISFITCGRFQTICLTENNLCYIWGWNNTDQLGLGGVNTCYTPTLFSLPNNERISFISSFNHAICLTENNLCYVWGYNKYGQLGLGDTNNRSSPTLFSLPNNERISFITCGRYHTLCVTENNLCYVWGFNKYGQLGLGDTNDRSTPTLLNLKNTI